MRTFTVQVRDYELNIMHNGMVSFIYRTIGFFNRIATITTLITAEVENDYRSNFPLVSYSVIVAGEGDTINFHDYRLTSPI